MTLPMLVGMIGMVAFNLVDTFFVGQLGTIELAALSFTFPVVMLVASLALGLGVGSSAMISLAIGKGDSAQVKRLTSDSIVLAAIFGAFFVVVGLLSINRLFTLLGADKMVMPLVRQYMVIWYLGAFFVFVPMLGNSAIRATGDTKTPSLIMMIAVIVNLIMDPILIFGLGPFPRLELAGAALATVLARGTTFVVSLWVLYYREEMISLAPPSFKEGLRSWKSILFIGLPAAGTNIVMPFGLSVITRLVAAFGPAAVAAFGVATRIEFFAMSVLMALTSVLGPFVGQNWAARRRDRVMQGVKYSSRFSMFWGAAMYLLLVLSARFIAPLFNDNPEVISTVVLYFMIVPAAYGFRGALRMANTTLNVLNRPLQASLLMIIQMFVLYIPMAWAGSYLFGLPGIFSAIVLSYALAGTASYLILMRVMRENLA